jgi:hypothetical protein
LAQLRRLAADELRAPSGAYDKIVADGSHPLQWLLSTGGDNMPRYARRPARDQELDLDPRGAESPDDYNGNNIDSDDCLNFIQMLLQRLSPEEHDALIAKLANLIQSAHENDGAYGGGVPNNNQGSLDRSSRQRTNGDRRPAQDSARALNTKGFLQRFPDAAKINVYGGCR